MAGESRTPSTSEFGDENCDKEGFGIHVIGRCQDLKQVKMKRKSKRCGARNESSWCKAPDKKQKLLRGGYLLVRYTMAFALLDQVEPHVSSCSCRHLRDVWLTATAV
jgi:hypothetical protein